MSQKIILVMSNFENKFEKFLWNLRYIVIPCVLLSILSSITLFIIASWDILYAILFQNPLFSSDISGNTDLKIWAHGDQFEK